MSVQRCMIILSVVAATSPGASLAQDFDLSWHTIDGGGHMFSMGGSFDLGGTIGQPDAGAMTGGSFELVGGFWAVAGGAAPCDPCDMNCDGIVNANDIQGFIERLFNDADPCCGNRGEPGHSGDTNGDGVVNANDIQGFIDCLFG